jgi:3'-phosphoadenosine 5'-phosphosulfate sulfotransferase (PAPS reductase)/FAD synthetase
MIVHFSCGAASAVSALLALKYHDNVELVYTDPGLEHEDNHRFLRDFEKLTSTKVTVLKHKKYKSPFDVFEARRFLAGPAGAPCTTELKKITAREYLGDRLLEEVNVFGFDSGESRRANRYTNNNPELKIWFPLIEYNICKSDCYYILDEMGLDLPFMYKLGYKNANCTGCVKAQSLGYWAAIREDFPKVFNWYAKFEREIGAKDSTIHPMRVTWKPRGAAINKRYEGEERIRVFLDELPKDQKPTRNISFTCGYSCGAQDMELATEELTKEPTLIGYMIAQELKEIAR